MRSVYVNKLRFVGAIRTFVSILIFGIVFLCFALQMSMQTIPDNYVETEARIIRIEEELAPDRIHNGAPKAEDYYHRVFVEYSYRGRVYTDLEYGNYDSSMQEGDAVILFLDPDAPAEFISDPSGSFVFVIIGTVVVLIGIAGLAYSIYQKKRSME